MSAWDVSSLVRDTSQALAYSRLMRHGLLEKDYVNQLGRKLFFGGVRSFGGAGVGAGGG